MQDVKIQYPKGETVWVIYANRDGAPVCILTSKESRDYYFLYEVLNDGKLKKLGKAKEPPELENKFNVKEKMMCSKER